MTDINKTILIGRLTRDAEIKYTTSGTAIATCSIAVNASRKDQSGNWVDEANFFDVTLFGKAAENLKAYLLKGKQIAVEGHLKQDILSRTAGKKTDRSTAKYQYRLKQYSLSEAKTAQHTAVHRLQHSRSSLKISRSATTDQQHSKEAEK